MRLADTLAGSPSNSDIVRNSGRVLKAFRCSSSSVLLWWCSELFCTRVRYAACT